MLGNDLTYVFLPHHAQVAKHVAEFGRLPLWDTSGFAGRPMVGNPQGGLFYPPVWLAWWSRSPAALGWLTVGHLIWAGLGVYVLLRSLRAGRARPRWRRVASRPRLTCSPTRSRAIIRTSGPRAGIPGPSGPSSSIAGDDRAARCCWRRSWP